MSQSSQRFVVVLGHPSTPMPMVPGVVQSCASASEADLLLDTQTPDAVVVDCGISWHRAAAERARHKGSAIIAVGDPPPTELLADEWVRDLASEPDMNTRLALAVARARERRRVVRRSCTDLLTGVRNRRELLRCAVQLAARAQRTGNALALILLDLDRFKEVNDQLGHPEGDRVLRRVGQVLRREVRQGEVCGRIGGDEFAVVLTGGLGDATLVRDRIVTALRAAGISASSGIAVARGGQRLRHLYADADAALLAAKVARPRAVGSSVLRSSRKEVESNDELNVA